VLHVTKMIFVHTLWIALWMTGGPMGDDASLAKRIHSNPRLGPVVVHNSPTGAYRL
jgi:hypothetical protein